MTLAFLEKFERLKPFSDRESWTLFRVAAFAEAIGWSLLGIAILAGDHLLPRGAGVKIAGQIHGTCFLFYIAITCVAYASLGWSRKRTVIALAASVPPFGSLVFEQWESYRRHRLALKHRRELSVRAVITSGDSLLAIQPKDSGFWLLPGGAVLAGEQAEDALIRHITAQTGVVPTLGRLAYVVQSRHRKTEQLELFFVVEPSEQFVSSAKQAHIAPELDELQYIQPERSPDLRPEFLQHEPLAARAQQKDSAPIFITEEVYRKH